MDQWNDAELLSAYVSQQSEAAFETLVERYIALVYSAALRQVHNPQLAQEVTQAVFFLLAQKARRLHERTVLAGWLCHAAYYVARNAVKAELRRQFREKEAYMQSLVDQPETEAWQQFAPVLDEAVAQLNEADRNAVVLRFYEQKPLNEVGGILGIDPDTAQKRVSRALEKLRRFFAKRGMVSTTAMIAGAISGHSVQAAPVGLAKTISAVAVTKGVAVSASTLTLAKEALKLMAWTKAQTAIVVGVGILLAAGTATLTVKEIQNYRNDNFPWQVENPTSDILKTFPPLVKIVPTKFPNRRGTVATLGPSSLGIDVTLPQMLRSAYNYDAFDDPYKTLRMLILTKVPSGNYDYIANFRQEQFQQEEMKQASGDVEVLQTALKKQFGLVGRREMIMTNVLLLEVKSPNKPGLKLITTENHDSPNHEESGEIALNDQGCKFLSRILEYEFRTTVLDGTRLTNSYYYDLKWTPSQVNEENQLNLKQALLDQLGLELVPTNLPVKMLVIEKAE